MFDVKHTSREVYDSTKRKLFKSEGIMGSDVILSEHQDSVAMEIDSDDSSSSDIFQENEVNNSNKKFHVWLLQARGKLLLVLVTNKCVIPSSYCMCTNFSGIHILAKLVLNQVR